MTKLGLVPYSVVGVLFPAFATSFVQDEHHTALLFMRGVKYLFLVMFPVTLFIITMAHEGLNLWLGADFAENSTRVLQWLALGVFFNSLAQVPFALIQGAGRPDLTARLHLIELPFYIFAVWWMLVTYGIVGAALVWAARMAIDAIFLFIIAQGFLVRGSLLNLRNILMILMMLLPLIVAMFLTGIVVKEVYLFTLIAVFMFGTWFVILSSEERAFLVRRMRNIGFSK